MSCNLCGKKINGYTPSFHHLKIDEAHGYDICPMCVDKFFKWQREILGKLFPTKILKKRV